MSKKLARYGIYAFAVLLVFLPGWTKYQKMLARKQANEKKLQELRQENERLKEEARKLKEDPLYLEGVARENLGLAKDGEIVVKFKPDQKD